MPTVAKRRSSLLSSTAVEETGNSPHIAHFWAFASIAVFPLTLLVLSALGATAGRAFGMGIIASIVVIALNTILEGYPWMFHPHWRKHFEHPEFSVKLAVISGTLLILVETALLIFFFTSPGLDRSLMNLVFARRCQVPHQSYAGLCQALQEQFELEDISQP